MNRTHPLEIPEILTRVGRHVPLWVHTKPTPSSPSSTTSASPESDDSIPGSSSSSTLLHSAMGPPYFDPRHLLACIQVNRTWHDIFLPILCFSFDDTAVHTAPITTFVPSITTTTTTSTPTEGEPRPRGGGGPVMKVMNRNSPAVNFFLRNSLRFRLLVLTRPCAPILSLSAAKLPIHLLHLELVGLDDDNSTTPSFSHSSQPPLSFSTPPASSSLSSSSSVSTFPPSIPDTTTTSAHPHSTSCTNDWSKTLILQNTRLQSLRWQGGDFQRDNHGMLDSLALAEKLHRLQDLVLECWRLDQGFVELLRSNPGLRTLALDFVTGEALPPPPPPPPSLEEGLLMTGWEGGGGGGVGNSSTATMVSSSSSWSSSSYLSSLLNIPSSASSNGAYTQAKSPTITTPTTTVTGRYPPEWHDEDNNSYHHHHHYNHHPYSPKQKNPNPYGFQLLHLTCLSVCKDVESGAFETLIRLCPNLEELSWMGPLDSDLEELTINLAECCPRVAVLTYSTVDVSEPEHRYAALVRSLPALVDLQIRIPTLEGGEFAKALLSQHATTLEILDLRIVNNRRPLSSATSEQSRESLRKILMGCSELTALSIEGAERMSEYLFLFTWACSPRLHRLFLAASISGDAGGGGSAGLGGGDVVVALQGPGQGHDQDLNLEGYEELNGNGGGFAGDDDFVSEAALYGWSVMGNSRPSPRHRRHASGTNINDLEDVDEEEEEEEEEDHHQEGELADATGSNPTGSITSSDTGLAGDIVHSHQGSSTTPFTTTTTTTTTSASPAPSTPDLLHTANNSIIPGDEDTPMPIVPLTTSSSSSLSTAGTTSFVRAMMHRLEDMPRLQSFVLNGVEYTRMPSLLVTR